MALREFMEGDCGGASPMLRLTSHFIQDHGFKQEGIRHPFNVPESFENADPDQLVKEFLEESITNPQSFRMDNLLQEMREIDHTIRPPVMAPGIVKELSTQDTVWANQYVEDGRHFHENHKDEIWNSLQGEHSLQMVPISTSLPQETHELGLGPQWATEYLEHSIDKKIDDSINGNIISEKISNGVNTENPNFAFSKFMKFMRQEGDIPVEQNQSLLQDEKWSEEFSASTTVPATSDQSTEEGNSENNVAQVEKEPISKPVEEDSAAAGSWVEEFTNNEMSSLDAENFESAFWERLQKEWDKISTNPEDKTSESHPWLSEYGTYYDPYKKYAFNENNPMKNLSDAFAEGKRRLEEGDLPSAVLCFEAAVQQEPENVEAWLMLGKSQAENEQDPLAISALKQCLVLDPTNSVALMALAVSYTNESYQNQACLTLKEWLLKNEKYKHLATTKSSVASDPASRTGVSTILFNDVHEEVKGLYIEAARMNPRDGVDADVQCGLGVLFNLSSEYDKAADCFHSALQVRPNDSRLWNRLGATLANGQRSEEAIDAYRRALELSPGFIRARYNLGISCINLGAYKEAGEHLLTALNQQAAGRGAQGEVVSSLAMSDTIWSTLRLVVSLMHKHYLTEAIENRDLPRLNREFEIE